VSTGFGYIDIGPKNYDFATFYTDRAKYYFDKEIQVNTGQIGSVNTNLYLRTGGTTRLTIETNGNATFTGSVTIPPNKWIGFGPFLEDNPRLALHHNGTHGYIDYMDNLHFRANYNWISALTLYGNGTVGVGFSTTYSSNDYRNQGYKLAVNGGIVCEEVMVINDVPDADFVFEQDYNLISIHALETFVNKNKHLPNIPSAEQFKKEGYKVGEMNEMLLQKIEKFSLYLIQLNKQVEALEKENRELKALITQ